METVHLEQSAQQVGDSALLFIREGEAHDAVPRMRLDNIPKVLLVDGQKHTIPTISQELWNGVILDDRARPKVAKKMDPWIPSGEVFPYGSV